MSDNIKNQIMNEIKDDRIRMKSRWIFVAKSLGLKSGLALSVVMFIFFVNAFLYYIKSNDLLLPLHYGPSSWQHVVHSLPYDVILILITLILLLNFIIKKFEFSYSHPFVIVFTLIILGSVFISSVLFTSSFNSTFREKLHKHEINVPYITDFYLRRCCQQKMCR